MELRAGKTKSILESSIDAALLAVEVYNKPRTTFRSQAYITLMIMAWTRLFHAHFNKTIGAKYFYKEKNGRYKIIDGEKKAWELKTCIKYYPALSDGVKKNLEFFIKLRNKIEHREIDKKEVDIQIFGECQALLYNYESLLISIFGRNYAISESLVYSLQFAHLRSKGQVEAGKSALSKDLKDLINYINTYRTALPENVFASQEYSIKLMMVPKIAASSRADLAIEFVKLDELDPQDRQLYENLSVLVKEKKQKVEGINVGKLRPTLVINKVNEILCLLHNVNTGNCKRRFREVANKIPCFCNVDL